MPSPFKRSSGATSSATLARRGPPVQEGRSVCSHPAPSETAIAAGSPSPPTGRPSSESRARSIRSRARRQTSSLRRVCRAFGAARSPSATSCGTSAAKGAKPTFTARGADQASRQAKAGCSRVRLDRRRLPSDVAPRIRTPNASRAQLELPFPGRADRRGRGRRPHTKNPNASQYQPRDVAILKPARAKRPHGAEKHRDRVSGNVRSHAQMRGKTPCFRTLL